MAMMATQVSPPLLQPLLSELRSALIDLYGARLRKLILFGSQARGDARPWSDADLMLVLSDPVSAYEEGRRVAQVLGDLSLKYDAVLMGHYVGEQECSCSQHPLLVNVRHEGITL